MAQSKKINVVKRNGTTEPLDFNKLHKVVMWACEGQNAEYLAGVFPSELEMNLQLQFYDGITTKQIHETLIKAAADLISEQSPNYQIVAGRLISYSLRKQAYNSYEPPHLYDHYINLRDRGYYTQELTDAFTQEEWNAMNDMLVHERDESITYAGMEQLRRKYLLQNRVTGEIFETPQMMYMLIAATLFSKQYKNSVRLAFIRQYYDLISNHVISLPTPVMAGARTPDKQFSSCVLIETDDSLNSLGATSSAIMQYVSRKAGIGIGFGRVRAIKSPVRNGATYHTGVVPFIQMLQSSVKSCSQGSVRGGAATLYFPLWHLEVEDMLVLKNNKGTEESRARHLDYGVQINKLLYERLISGKDITLFSPNDVPELYEAFFEDQNKFEKLYKAAERNPNIRKKNVSALELFTKLIQERVATGRIYIMNVDHCNTHSSFNVPIRMSNLCVAGETVLTVINKQTQQIEDITIQDLVENFEQSIYEVYCYDTSTKQHEFKPVLAAAMTGTEREVLEIYDEASGKKLICTPEHQIYTTNRGYVLAKDLKETDQLVFDE